jgi:hypothetical protein
MMNCKQATELMSQAQDRLLSRRERLALRLHLLICKGCSNYSRQLAFIREAMQRLNDRSP